MTEAAPTASRAPGLYAMRGFQTEAVTTIGKVLKDTARLIEADFSRRQDIARATGVTLLRSPTGSGKTLTIGRALESVVGSLQRRTVWFWFTPFSGLVAQTRDALASQCPQLRLRDASVDRGFDGTQDGDVFVLTWQSVASARQDARRARQADDTVPGLDTLLTALRADFYIGVVIDEAHLNFGTGAPQAAAFYLDVVKPDFTVLATATPKDEDLERFQRASGIGEVNRVEVSRERVVKACLNKVGVKAVHFRADDRDERVLDMQEVAIYAGLARHRLVKAALKEAGINLNPLMLIQVENVSANGADPVDRVREILKDYGIPSEKTPGSPLAVHTSAEPDPFFHTLAYDETKEILVFKMSAATGFDAPRAWTLVSLRKAVGPEFGLQVIGRIMRVHPRLQGLHPFASDPPRQVPNPLDYGYVFLANPEHQFAMVEAARELRDLRDTVKTVTDDAVVVRVGADTAVLLNPENGFAELLDMPRPGDGAYGGPPEMASSLHDTTKVDATENLDAKHPWTIPADLATLPNWAQAERVQPLLDGLWSSVRSERDHHQERSASPSDGEAAGSPPHGLHAYPLRTDVVFPRKLAREVMPKTMDGLVQCIARRIDIDDTAIALVQKTLGKVHITEEDVFGDERARRTENVPLSAARIAQGAQQSFRFNDSIDERDLKPALVERLRRELEDRGVQIVDERHLRRGVDLLALARPQLLTEACRTCLAEEVDIRQDEEIPAFYAGPHALERSERNLYGVFPADMNKEELAFARVLDQDQSGTVMWWIRNQSQARWAVSIVLPNGERHFPDFVVGVDQRRKSDDHIALAEVKDDGKTGRLFSDKNIEKVRTEHARYRSCLMVFRTEQGEWFNVAYRPELQRHQAGAKFKVDDLARVY